MASRGTVADVDAPSLVVELGDPFFADVRADASPLRGFVDAGKIREIEKLIAPDVAAFVSFKISNPLGDARRASLSLARGRFSDAVRSTDRRK